MDTDGLKALVKIAETGSFSRAAEKLHITQPAISKRILNLERDLGTPLFDRIGKRNRLTAAGIDLLPRARDILWQLEDARRAISDLTDHVQGRLALATNHHIGLWRLPPVLQRYCEAYPDVVLDLRFMDSVDAERAIREGDLDLGVFTLASDPHPELLAVPLWLDPLVFVAASTHPLAGVSAIGLETLIGFPAILPDLNTFTGRIVHDLFQSRGLSLRTTVTTNYLETIRMLITIGLGWSVLPRIMLDDSTLLLDVPTTRMHRHLGYIHHRHATLSNPARAFTDLLLQNRDTLGD